MSDENVDPDLFSIIPGRSPSNAIVTGPMSEVMEYIGGSVARMEKEQQIADAQRDVEQTAREQEETRIHNAQMFANGIAHLATRLDAYEARRQARADQLQREAEEAQNRATEEFLAGLPDPDDLTTTALLPATGDGSPHDDRRLLTEISDDGDFEAVNPPPDKEKYAPTPTAQNCAVETEGEVRAETITGVTPPDLEETTPPQGGDYTSTAPAPSPYRNPASIGLN
jgi:hypothetical protein